MIVKNEAHIIEEALNGVVNCTNLHYWVICDTGSTDGTQDLIIKFFKKHGIKGELKQHKWVDFDVNRTWAFEAAEGKANYMWVLDADDVPRGKFVIPKKMYHDKYNLNYRSGTMIYVRPQLFKSGLKWEYIGVLHEFAEPRNKERPSIGHITGDYYIDSRRLGDRSLNPLKYYKDGKKISMSYEKEMQKLKDLDGKEKLEKLEKEFAKNPKNKQLEKEIKKVKIWMKSNERKTKMSKTRYLMSRYAFYAGQSYRDYGDTEYSEKWYRKRANKPISYPYDEECYQARIECANAAIKMKKSDDEIENLYVWAHEIFPFGAEPLHKMAAYYNSAEKFEKAYDFAKRANALPFPKDALLFVAQDIYDWRAAKEHAYAALKLGYFKEAFGVMEDKLIRDLVPRDEIRFWENMQNMCLEDGKLMNETSKYPAEKVKMMTHSRKTKNVKCVIPFTDWDKTTKTINSFLNCCKDAEYIEKWIVHGLKLQPNISKLYPFIEYVQVESESVNVLELCDYQYNIFIEGRWCFIYETDYVLPYIDTMQSNGNLDQVQYMMQSGNRVDMNGMSFNESKVTMMIPSIFRKEIKEDSYSVTRRQRSTIPF